MSQILHNMKIITDTIMPFGLHKGTPVSELPESYLRWLAENCELWGPLKDAVEARLNAPAPTKKPATGVDDQILTQWYIALSERFGRDRESMAVVRECVRQLQTLLRS